MPAIDEMYWGTDKAAFYKDSQIISRKGSVLNDPLAFMAVPSNAHRLYNISFSRLRSFGSTSAHLAYAARGVAIAVLTRDIKVWDIAAVLPLLKAADVGLVILKWKDI